MIDIRHLRYFKTVAEELHFRKAAEKLCVSQPPLSMQIKQLEQFLDTKLFIRTSRSVKLTKAGEHFYQKTLTILKDIETAAQETRLIGAGKSGSINIGFVSSSAVGFFQRAVLEFSKHYPDVILNTQQLTNQEIVTKFKDGDIDIGFCRLPLSIPEDLQSLPLVVEDYIIALPENWDTMKLPNLLSQPLIVFSKEKAPELYKGIISIFEHYSITPQISYEATEQLTLLGMVAAGLGIAIIPKSVSNCNLDGVAYTSFKDIKKQSTLALITRKETDNHTQNFIESTFKLDIVKG